MVRSSVRILVALTIIAAACGAVLFWSVHETSPYDPVAARRACVTSADCWLHAKLLAADGVDGDRAVDRFLADQTIGDAPKHALIERYLARRPDWGRSERRLQAVIDAVAATGHEPLLHALPIQLHIAAIDALEARGLRLRIPVPGFRRGGRSDAFDLDHHAKWMVFCEAVLPRLHRRLLEGEGEPIGAAAILRHRCADSDAALTALARFVDSDAGKTTRTALAGGVAPHRVDQHGLWDGCVHRRRPWDRMRAFFDPAIRCATTDQIVDFAGGPYRMHWPADDKRAFVEAIIEWRGRCASAGDWSVLFEQLGETSSSAVQAAHAPETLSCARAEAALQALRAPEQAGHPRSVTVLTAFVRTQCESR